MPEKVNLNGFNLTIITFFALFFIFYYIMSFLQVLRRTLIKRSVILMMKTLKEQTSIFYVSESEEMHLFLMAY